MIKWSEISGERGESPLLHSRCLMFLSVIGEVYNRARKEGKRDRNESRRDL